MGVQLEQNSLRVCPGGMFEGGWDCARIDVLGRTKPLAWGGDQAGEEAEGRRLWEVFLPRQEALKVTAWVEEGAARLEGPHPSEPWTHLPAGIQPPDPVTVELLWSPCGRFLGPVGRTPDPRRRAAEGCGSCSTSVPAVSSLRHSSPWW